jgi:DNA-binding protein YbaB
MSEPRWDALFGNPDGAERGIDDWVAGLRQRADRLDAVRTRVEEIRVEETSANGAVTVTVDANGVLSAIRFSERVANVRPDELSTSVMSALHTAQSRIAERVQEATEAELGDDLPDTGRMLVDSYRDRFGGGEPAPHPRPDDDQFGEQSFLG